MDPNKTNDELSQTIADVFGLGDFGTPADTAATTAEQFSEQTGDEPPQNASPSVGTEGTGEGSDGGASPSSAAPSPVTTPGSAPSDQQPATPPAATPEAPAAPSASELELASLKAQVAALSAQLAEKPGSGESAPDPAGTQPTAPQPLNVQLPDELFAAITSEDPMTARQGMNTLVSTIATGLNFRFEARLAELREEVGEKFTAKDSEAQAAARQDEAAQQRAEYFEAFPTHNKPILLPSVAQEAAQLAAEFPNLPWDKNFVNALGVRVNNKLAELQGSTPVPSAPSIPAPAPFTPGGNRQPVDTNLDLISETLGL